METWTTEVRGPPQAERGVGMQNSGGEPVWGAASALLQKQSADSDTTEVDLGPT